jgi:hypothetical protein
MSLGLVIKKSEQRQKQNHHHYNVKIATTLEFGSPVFVLVLVGWLLSQIMLHGGPPKSNLTIKLTHRLRARHHKYNSLLPKMECVVGSRLERAKSILNILDLTVEP